MSTCLKVPFLLAGFNEKILFVRPAPIDQEETSKQKKQKQGQKKVAKPSKSDTGASSSTQNITNNVQNMTID